MKQEIARQKQLIPSDEEYKKLIENCLIKGETRIKIFEADAHSLSVLGYYRSAGNLMAMLSLGYFSMSCTPKVKRHEMKNVVYGCTAMSMAMWTFVNFAKRSSMRNFVVRIEFCTVKEQFVVVQPNPGLFSFGQI